MRIREIVFSVIALSGSGALLWAGYSVPVHAQTDESEASAAMAEHDTARGLVRQGDILPLGQILQMARQHHPGRVLETELDRKHDQLVYEIELVDEHGEVWEMKFDARSGAVLKEEQED
ncbi:MAG: PepSY domain-containing protein [Gammaproteobacteria bacterium]|jgi:uncharacterized membrane protein YkoI